MGTKKQCFSFDKQKWQDRKVLDFDFIFKMHFLGVVVWTIWFVSQQILIWESVLCWKKFKVYIILKGKNIFLNENFDFLIHEKNNFCIWIGKTFIQVTAKSFLEKSLIKI